MIAAGHKANFEMLQAAFNNNDVALMECQLAATGEPVAVLCASNRLADGEVERLPCFSTAILMKRSIRQNRMVGSSPKMKSGSRK